MAIINKLRLVMAERRIDNLTDLIRITGLSRNALNKLWHDQEVETLKLETLIQICQALDLKLSDLVEYLPEDEGVPAPANRG